jgi:hypothetical protein
MKNLRRAHLAVGLLGFIAFAMTGQYMELLLGHLRDIPDAPRLMFRSAHIYVLYGALLNAAVGSYFRPLTGRTAKRLQVIGSITLLIVPLLLLVSFFVESHNNPLSRPIAVAGIYLSLLSIALHVMASLAGKESHDGS